MGRIILGIIVGFVVWTLLFVGGEPLLRAISPNLVVPIDITYFDSPLILLGYLVRSIIASIVAGFTAAMIARESGKTTLILGIVFLIVGILVQVGNWSKLPIWYHLIFLALLIPMTILGGKLKKREPLA